MRKVIGTMFFEDNSYNFNVKLIMTSLFTELPEQEKT